MSITQLIEEAAGPYRGFGAELVGDGRADAGTEGGARRAGGRAAAGRHLRPRQPGRERRRLCPRARGDHRQWSAREVAIDHRRRRSRLPAEVMDALGEPYITTRPAAARGRRRTASHRAWASDSSSPRPCWSAPAPPSRWKTATAPERGAIVRVSWPREAFESRAGGCARLRRGLAARQHAGSRRHSLRMPSAARLGCWRAASYSGGIVEALDVAEDLAFKPDELPEDRSLVSGRRRPGLRAAARARHGDCAASRCGRPFGGRGHGPDPRRRRRRSPSSTCGWRTATAST